MHAHLCSYIFPNYLIRKSNGLGSRKISFITGCPLNFLNYDLGPVCLLSLMALIGIRMAKIAEEKGHNLKVDLHIEHNIWREWQQSIFGVEKSGV